MGNHKIMTSALAGVLVVAGLTVGAAGAAAEGNTLVVGNPTTCPGAQYSRIQAAVDDASPGDTISVCKGTYGEHVTIDTPNLTLLGAQAGVDARGKRPKANNTTVSDPTGEFTLTGNADDTTIDGFVLTGATGNNDGVADFQGSSGLTLVNNVIQLNGNGINLQNPDGSKPATIAYNSFNNNNAGGVGNGETGTGVFISNGPAVNTLIQYNNFRQHSQTAINFAGDSARPSTGLVVSDNKSTDDSTFVVAVNSGGAVIDHNNITTSDANAPGGHGTGILDFGANTALRITNNVMKATTTTSQSSGIAVSNYAGSSQYTDVLNNTVTGWYNDIKIVSGSTNAYVNGNRTYNAVNDGIIVQADVSGATISRNRISTAGNFACEDNSTGNRTAGTANVWTNNVGTTASSPAGICAVK